MQSRRREHRSSGGELDVFGATSYFAGLPPPASADDDCRCRPSSATEPPPSADRLYFQAAKVVQRDTSTTRTMATEGNSFRGPHQQQQLAGLHGHAERHDSSKQLLQVVASKRQQPYSGKSKLAALLSFMVSPSPSRRANSFRKDINKEAPSTSTSTRLRHQAEAAASAAGAGEKDIANNTCKAANSRSSSSRESIMLQLQGLLGAHDDDDELVDLGVATGDRRLQGITVVRGIGGDEERWVVRCVPCGAWDDEEHREKMLDVDAAESASSEQNIKDETMMVEVEQPGHGDDGNIDLAHSWDSDSSSDLFDLDLEY